ncbi:MAG: hypothetical protein WC971_09770, partial [Coriobacteriia bacterium]
MAPRLGAPKRKKEYTNRFGPVKPPRCLRKNVLETDSMPQKKRYSNRPTPDRPAKGHEDAAFDARE